MYQKIRFLSIKKILLSFILCGFISTPIFAEVSNSTLENDMAAVFPDSAAKDFFIQYQLGTQKIVNSLTRGSLYNEPYTKVDSLSPYALIISNHLRNCSPEDTREAGLSSGCLGKDSLSAGGDIKLSTILATPILNTSEQELAEIYARNLMSPFPSTEFKDLTKAQLSLDPPADPKNPVKSMVEPYAQALANEATLSPGRLALAEMIARRIPLTVTGPDPKDSTKTVTIEVSMMQYLEQQIMGERLFNAAWLNKVATLSETPGALQGEQTVLQALQLYVDLLKLKQGEVMTAELAALVSLNVRGAQVSSATLGKAGGTGP